MAEERKKYNNNVSLKALDTKLRVLQSFAVELLLLLTLVSWDGVTEG